MYFFYFFFATQHFQALVQQYQLTGLDTAYINVSHSNSAAEPGRSREMSRQRKSLQWLWSAAELAR